MEAQPACRPAHKGTWVVVYRTTVRVVAAYLEQNMSADVMKYSHFPQDLSVENSFLRGIAKHRPLVTMTMCAQTKNSQCANLVPGPALPAAYLDGGLLALKFAI